MMRLNPHRTALLLCDMQTGFRNIIYNMETVISKTNAIKNTCEIMVMILQ